MKTLKYFFSIILLIGIGFSIWLYYPQYQIQQMKKQAVEVSNDPTHISYLNYFRNYKETTIYHLALGDSVIRGVGADQDQNLVSQFSKKLSEIVNKKIQFRNEGLSGLTSSGLEQLVQSGRFDNEIKQADIITINIGGNDILRLAKKRNFKSIVTTFNQIQSDFSKNLSNISSRIKRINPKATIVFLELYNPLPTSDKMYPIADKLLPSWNIKIYEVSNEYPSSIVIETTKVINGEKPQNLSKDGIHPNTAGYSAISDLMIYQFKHEYRKESV